MQDRSNQILGHYRLIRPLGKGGYAEVYLAENTNLGIEVAIKVLKSRELQSYEQEEFRDEAKLIALLDHPHIVKIYDYAVEINKRGADGSIPYIVMEYARYGSLRQHYPRGTAVPLPKIVSYTRQIAEALQYAHDSNPSIVHRDVKPENMLVRKPDVIVLSDFGIAVSGLATGNLQLQIEQILEKMTRREEVQIAGTAHYLAPERHDGRTQRASDQYSLAVVVYEWLCGYRPFEGGSDLEICRKHQTEPPPPLSKAYPHISSEVEQVVMKALAKAPANRYKSVQDFALALEHAAGSISQKVTSVPPTPPPSDSQRSPVFPPGAPARSKVTPVFNPPSPDTVFPPTPVTPPTSIRGPQLPPPSHARELQQPLPVRGIPHQGPYDNQPWYQQPIPTQFRVDESVTMRGDMSSTTSSANQIGIEQEGIVKTAQRAMVTDTHFLKIQRYRLFFPLMAALNVLFALFVLPIALPWSVVVAILGGALAVFMLRRCVISVKKPIAIAFGVGVALWWGYALGSLVGALSHSADASLPFFLLAFVLGIIVHVWYVQNRLKS